MSIVIDIAWDRPSVAQILATGAVGVLRYFSTDSTKNLAAAEVTAYHAAGLGVGDVWETSPGRATQGFAAGVADARAAEVQRAADGLPADQTVFFAVDEDTSWASVQPYFDGAHSVLGVDAHGIPRTGTYGGFAVIEGAYAHGLRRLWQTLAWSQGRKSGHAVLYQNGSTVFSGQADINEALAPDWGQYPNPQEADMPFTDADAATLMAHQVPDLALPDGKGSFKTNPIIQVFERAGDRHNQVVGLLNSLTAQVGALTALLQKLAAGGTLSAAEAEAAAKAGAAAALAEAEAAAKRVMDALQPPAPAAP